MFRSVRFLLFLLIPFLSSAQDIKFYTETESRQVAADGYFEVYFKVDNGIGQDLQPPSFSGFNVLGGPSFSSQTSIINGDATRSTTFTYVLEPKSTGRFTIGPATVTVGGRKYTSEPVTIEVVKAAAASQNDLAGNGTEVFVRMEADREEGYPGQQIILDYVLYSRIDVSTWSFNSESKYTGIYVKPFKNFDIGAKIKNINGYQYRVRLLRRLALFPQQSGSFHIDPAVITLAIPMDDDPFGSLFSSSRPKQVRTNGLDLSIRPLPPPPQGFLGAVGQFEYSVTCDKTSLSTDDAAMLSFKISGNGDMKTIQAPQIKSDEEADFYPPEVLEDNEVERSGEWFGSKTYVVDLTPKKTGNISIKVPPFIYFDPKQNSYKTISVEPIPLSVSQGNDKPAGTDDAPGLAPSRTFFQQYRNVILASAGGLVLISFLAFFVFRKDKPVQDEAEEPAPLAVTKIPPSAPEVLSDPVMPQVDYNAIATTARTYLDQGNTRDFARHLNTTLTAYLSEKLDIPLSRFNTSGVREVLSSRNTDPEIILRIVETMNRLESAAYGGFLNDVMPEELLEDVRFILDKI